MKTLYSILSCMLVFLLVLPGESYGQNPETNKQIILDETTRLLQRSTLLNEIDGAFTLETNVPQNLHSVLVEPLVKMGKQVMLEPSTGQKIKLEIHPRNSFTRLSRREGQRHIQGEIILYRTNSENVILQTESYTFSHMDTVSVRNKEALSDPDWYATGFHDESDGRRRSFISRVGEPVVLIGASAVTIFLLYNVRR